jgi:hypothetical protein
MSNAQGRISRDIAGKPIVVGDFTMLPTIQARGWSLEGGTSAGGASGWSLHVTPGPVLVRGPDGTESTLQLPSTTDTTVRALAGIGMGVAALCALLVVAARRG